MTTRSRGRCSGKGFLEGFLRVKDWTSVVSAAKLGFQLVLGGARLELFKLELHLIEKASLPLRALAIELAPELLDMELQRGNQRFDTRDFGFGSKPCRPLGRQCGPQSFILKIGPSHAGNYTIS